MNIREMQIDDLEAVMEIENECFSVPWTETGFFTFLIRNDTLFLAAEENGMILGYAGIVMVPEDGDITNVAVRPDCRKMGVGRAIVTELCARAKEQGVRHIFLEVRKSNAAAIALYSGLGFEPIGERKDYYEEPKEDAILMRLEQ